MSSIIEGVEQLREQSRSPDGRLIDTTCNDIVTDTSNLSQSVLNQDAQVSNPNQLSIIHEQQHETQCNAGASPTSLNDGSRRSEQTDQSEARMVQTPPPDQTAVRPLHCSTQRQPRLVHDLLTGEERRFESGVKDLRTSRYSLAVNDLLARIDQLESQLKKATDDLENAQNTVDLYSRKKETDRKRIEINNTNLKKKSEEYEKRKKSLDVIIHDKDIEMEYLRRMLSESDSKVRTRDTQIEELDSAIKQAELSRAQSD